MQTVSVGFEVLAEAWERHRPAAQEADDHTHIRGEAGLLDRCLVAHCLMPCEEPQRDPAIAVLASTGFPASVHMCGDLLHRERPLAEVAVLTLSPFHFISTDKFWEQWIDPAPYLRYGRSQSTLKYQMHVGSISLRPGTEHIDSRGSEHKGTLVNYLASYMHPHNYDAKLSAVAMVFPIQACDFAVGMGMLYLVIGVLIYHL